MSLDAEVKSETVEEFLVRKGKASVLVSMGVDTSGDYYFSLREDLYFYQNYAEYRMFVGSAGGKGSRGLVEVKYESKGHLNQGDDGNYYVSFEWEPERRVNSQITYPTSEFWEEETADGEYWIPALPQFKFRIKPTGVEGGRLWHASDTMQFNAHTAFWWTGWKYCRPKDNPKPSFLGFE